MYYTNKDKKKDKYFVGTINSTDLMLNRSGKINKGEYPELRTKVHKSKKDYSRKTNKSIARDALYSEE